MVMILITMFCTIDSYDNPLSLLAFETVFLAWAALTAVAVKRWYKIPEKLLEHGEEETF
jgi:hypothetical protein